MKRYLATVMVLLIVVSVFSVVSVWAQGPPEFQRIVFIHYAKPPSQAKPPPSETGYYKLIGAKWRTFPVPIEVNPSSDKIVGLDSGKVVYIIQLAAEEWDSGAYSQSEGIAWYGVTPNLFNGSITEINVTTTSKTYDDLAWTSDKLDDYNTLIWGNYPTSGVIAVTILWYNIVTKTIIEFDIVFDTDYAWGNATTTANVMDLQNIATHELGHGAGLGDVYQSAAYRETMYGYGALGETIKRDLYTGDKQGITKLYG